MMEKNQSMIGFLIIYHKMMVRGLEQTEKHRIYKITEWKKITKWYHFWLSVRIIRWGIISDKMDNISENRRNIYIRNRFYEAILDTDFDRTLRNEFCNLTVWRFGISEYLNIRSNGYFLKSLNGVDWNYALYSLL